MADGNYRSTIVHAGDEFFIGISPSGHAVTFDVKGDRHAAPTPMEMLLMSVAACTMADVVSILKKKRQDVTGYKVEIEADRREEHPRYFTRYELNHIVYGNNVSEDAVARAIELSDEKYCSVAAALRPKAEIETKFEVRDPE